MIYRVLISLLFIVSIQSLNAQDSREDIVYEFTENMPEFPGGEDSLIHYFINNLDYKQCATTVDVIGRLDIDFIVNEDGTATNAKVKGTQVEACNIEVNRMMSKMPKFMPGYQNGKPVKVRYYLPMNIHFE